MQTDELIRSLSSDLRPMPPYALERRLGGGAVIGAIATLVLVTSCLGLRPDLAIAVTGSTFWMKFGFTLTVGLGALAVTARLARPDSKRLCALKALLIPFALVAGIAAVELARSPVSTWSTLWYGESWNICPFLIFGLAVPIYLGLVVAFRRFAPSQLMATGGVAGLAAGGLAAAIYCLHCPEASALFVLTWYTLGMALATLAGALAGSRLLRW